MILKSICQVHAYEVEVKVQQGKIVGERETTVLEGKAYYAFYGVPYAKPPVGKRRFKEPVAAKNLWKLALDGRLPHHGTCAQSHIVHQHSIFGVEDCLYLNIYTPRNPKAGNAKANLAVMVFYHGFGFFSSFSHIYGPDFLIEHEVIVITATYRTGVFGFLDVNSTKVHKNMGLKDMVMSLQWIRDNIKQFGGDVNKITVMGSGSAATLLSLLLTTKKRHLFTKMILHSGSPFSPSILQGEIHKESEKFLKELNKSEEDDLMKAKAEDVIKVANKIYTKTYISNTQRPIVPFTPVLEDKSHKKSLLTKNPNDFYKEGLHRDIKIPVLIGFNTRESITEAVPFLAKPRLLGEFMKMFKFHVPFSEGCRFDTYREIYKDIFHKIKQHYFDPNITIDNYLHYTTDLQKYPVYKFIKAHSNSKSKIYAYKFNYQGKFNAVKHSALGTFQVKIKGAAHGDELCYLFKCVPFYDTYLVLKNDTTNRDRIFIKEMAEMWTNFAKTGDPNPKTYTDSAKWIPITEKEDAVMFINSNKKLISTSVEEKMFKFWNDLYESFYSESNCRKVKDEL